MPILDSLLPLTIASAPASGLLGYLGETNVLNVLIVIGLAVGLYKYKNMSVSRGLDAKISETLGALNDAESIGAAVEYQLSEAQRELKNLQAERADRVKAAELRGKSYSERLHEETDRKLHHLGVQAVQSRKLEAQHIERDSLKSLAQEIKQTTVKSLPRYITPEKHQALIVSALQDIEDIYWETCSPSRQQEVSV
jgi:F0F1-type ATP synthase membrane subunit b/b'